MPPDPQLKVAQVHYPLTALGPGRRLGLWVQGCTLACPGCMSRHTWDASDGTVLPLPQLMGIWSAALDDGAEGLTVSGGEPLQQGALVPVLDALGRLRDERRPAADILLYTGYTEREARHLVPEVFTLADALISGRFNPDLPTPLIWRGSANQKLTFLSPRGEERYSRFADHRPERPPIQISLTEDGDLQLLGVPRAGDLRQLRKIARQRGITTTGTSWEPGESEGESE
jgi:anaerobic ribonucleoside-triphosphate reductase activating protein